MSWQIVGARRGVRGRGEWLLERVLHQEIVSPTKAAKFFCWTKSMSNDLTGRPIFFSLQTRLLESDFQLSG